MHQLLQKICQVSMKHILIIDDYLLMQINQYHNFQKSFVQVETPLYLTSIPYQSSCRNPYIFYYTPMPNLSCQIIQCLNFSSHFIFLSHCHGIVHIQLNMTIFCVFAEMFY